MEGRVQAYKGIVQVLVPIRARAYRGSGVAGPKRGSSNAKFQRLEVGVA
jgi:hypothetical protein